jgi:hypothetical protein
LNLAPRFELDPPEGQSLPLGVKFRPLRMKLKAVI